MAARRALTGALCKVDWFQARIEASPDLVRHGVED
jgi:hypothetical protein